MRAVPACVAFSILAAFGGVAPAADGAQMAMDYGCINCHTEKSHSAGSMKRLSERMGGSADRPEAVQDMLREIRGQSAIHSHQMVPDEAALTILNWLAQGAK